MAPDLPEIGDSDIPKGGSDMKTAVIRIHTLAKSLGITKARVVGHDIGLMVRTRMPHSSPQKSRSSSLWTPSFLALPDGSSRITTTICGFSISPVLSIAGEKASAAILLHSCEEISSSAARGRRAIPLSYARAVVPFSPLPEFM